MKTGRDREHVQTQQPSKPFQLGNELSKWTLKSIHTGELFRDGPDKQKD